MICPGSFTTVAADGAGGYTCTCSRMWIGLEPGAEFTLPEHGPLSPSACLGTYIEHEADEDGEVVCSRCGQSWEDLKPGETFAVPEHEPI